jgi:diguanylate cyclase (GGDEF)-like protein
VQNSLRRRLQKLLRALNGPRRFAIASASLTLVIFFVVCGFCYPQLENIYAELEWALPATAAGIGIMLAWLAYLLTSRQTRMTARIMLRTSAIQTQLAELEQSEQVIRRYSERLRTLHAVDQAILAAESPEAIGQAVLEHLWQLSPDQQTSIFLFDDVRAEAYILANRLDEDTKPFRANRLPLSWVTDLDLLRQGKIFYQKDLGAIEHPSRLERLLLIRKIRGYFMVPLISREELIGSINFGKNTPGDFDTEVVEIALEVADSLAVAIKQAQLFETEAQRRGEAETLRETLAALTTNLNRNQILDRILDHLEKVIPYDSATLFLLRDQSLGAVAARGFKNISEIVGHEYSIQDDILFDRVYQTGKPVLIANARKNIHFQSWGNSHQIQGWMCIPLIARGKVIGCLTVDSYQLNAYQESDVALAEAFANQAAVALENARLYTAAWRRVTELNALNATISDITGELELSNLLEAILQRAIELSGATGGDLGLFDPETEETKIVVSLGMGRDFIGTRQKLGEGAMGHVALTREPLIISDYHQWQGRSPQYECGPWKSVMAAPLIVGGGLVGSIGIMGSESDKEFSGSDLELLNMFAKQAAIAVQNARLFGAVQQLAITDELTGVANRRQLFSLGRREIQRAQRFGRPLSAIMLDIDHFKQINDTYGHAIGDQVLRGVILACQNKIREIDIIGRYGGDEFAILLPETNLAIAMATAERLREDIEQTRVSTKYGPLNVTLSMGVAALNEAFSDLDTLLEQADIALYAAKDGGRNCVFANSPVIDTWV